ncbi:hypothetical protein [Streptomyces sp. NPDC006638]|uniref:hypothetical protein n=1 Tax=Streptomyces sp. NPDC006638 TaxID=3157183 RepID=UPI0033B8C00F
MTEIADGSDPEIPEPPVEIIGAARHLPGQWLGLNPTGPAGMIMETAEPIGEIGSRDNV